MGIDCRLVYPIVGMYKYNLAASQITYPCQASTYIRIPHPSKDVATSPYFVTKRQS